MQAGLMQEISEAVALRKQEKPGATPGSAALVSKAAASAIAENSSPQILKATQLFGRKDGTPQESDRQRRPGSARKLPSVAGICVDGEFFGGKVRGSPFKPENETAPTTGSTPTFVREVSPKGQKAEVLAVLAQRKSAVDATAIIVQTEFGDGSPSVRNRPKRSEEAVQKVMEARREHITAMEEEGKRISAAGQPGIDADMALAMGGHRVHSMEKTTLQQGVASSAPITSTLRAAQAATTPKCTPGKTKTAEQTTSKPTTPAPAPLQGWTTVPNTPISKSTSTQQAKPVPVPNNPPAPATQERPPASKQGCWPSTAKEPEQGAGGIGGCSKSSRTAPAKTASGKGDAMLRKRAEMLSQRDEPLPSAAPDSPPLAGVLDLQVDESVEEVPAVLEGLQLETAEDLL